MIDAGDIIEGIFWILCSIVEAFIPDSEDKEK